jgi:5-methylcytosine-specific restriction endonuclease McrA
MTDTRGRPKHYVSGHNGRRYWPNEPRQCCACKIVKPSDHFYTGTTRCKECLCEEHARYYLDNRDAALRRSQQWASDNTESKRTYNRQRYAENAEKLKAQARVWAVANSEKRRFYFHNREAMKLGNGGVLTAQEFRELCAIYSHACLACGAIDVPLQPDHVVPLSRGGRNSIENIQPLCGPCNFKKHTSIIDYRAGWRKCGMTSSGLLVLERVAMQPGDEVK